jgi:hypothetical protein
MTLVLSTKMDQQDLLELTTLIDDCNYSKELTLTVDMMHERLWTGLNKLRTATNKDELISEWKYKSHIMSTDMSHEKNNKTFEKVDWEKSYVLDFWMGIYH